MNDNMQQPVPMPPTFTPPPSLPTNGGRKVGPIIAILVIVLVLVVAAVYLFASRVNQAASTPATTDDTSKSDAPIMYDNTPTQTGSSSQTTVQPVTDKSTDPASLENDLNASTNGLDNQNF